MQVGVWSLAVHDQGSVVGVADSRDLGGCHAGAVQDFEQLHGHGAIMVEDRGRDGRVRGVHIDGGGDHHGSAVDPVRRDRRGQRGLP